jgi:predicted RNase H-like HicB family nuclease
VLIYVSGLAAKGLHEGDSYRKLKIVLVASDEGGYTAYVPSLPGCISEGDTREQAMANIREATELYLEPVEDDLPPSPDAEITEVAV